MTNNYTTAFQRATHPPETIDEAIDRLMLILTGEQKATIAALPEDDLITLHFSLGISIRNAFGLHEPNSKLLAACNNAKHPGILYNAIQADDASVMIIRELWEKLIDTNAAQ